MARHQHRRAFHSCGATTCGLGYKPVRIVVTPHYCRVWQYVHVFLTDPCTTMHCGTDGSNRIPFHATGFHAELLHARKTKLDNPDSVKMIINAHIVKTGLGIEKARYGPGNLHRWLHGIDRRTYKI